MTPRSASPRPNQKARTRKDLLQAAARLMSQGRKPGLEDIAAEALVSRATAYRYFPDVEALLLEASLDIAVPDPGAVFDGKAIDDPVVRLERAEAALHGMILANEPAMRMMLAHALQRPLHGTPDDALPVRQNRRTPLIEAALEPSRAEFKPATFRLLSRALALVIGTEAFIVTKDVLRLSEADAQKVRRWAIRALVEAAQRS